MTPRLAAYHAGLVTASVIALIAAGISQLVDDRAASVTMRSPSRPAQLRPPLTPRADVTIQQPQSSVSVAAATAAS